MADIFVNSGEDGDNTIVPSPVLQNLFIPGIDNPLSVDGFGIVTPWGGGSTTRKYSDYGISSDISTQSTQLNDLSNSFISAEVGNVNYDFEGLVGPQGIPGKDGTTLIIHEYVGLNSNYLTALPHNIDLINDLGTAADKLIYTDVLNTYAGSTEWVERQPAGAVDKDWQSVASDADGSNLIACVDGGRLYTSANYGISWTERQPAGAVDIAWHSVASDSDGSHLIAAVGAGRLYTSNNYGVSWTERRPAGDNDKDWADVASDADGSNLIACVLNGRLYISSDYGANWTERQPDDNDDNYWTSVASDDDGSVLIAGKGNTDTAALYISVDSGVNWSEEIPASATISWFGTASDADGSHLVAGADKGRLVVSADSGSSWTLKGASAGDYWHGVSTNSDGSYIIVCAALSSGHLYESFNSGATFAETKPAGAVTKNWWTVSTALEGGNTIVAVRGGRLYTGTISVGYSEATWAESSLTSAGRALLDDSDAETQRATLGVSIGSDVQAWDAQLDDVAALTVTNGNFMVGDGSNWVAESGDTARTSLGVGTGDSPTFAGVVIADGGTVGQAAGGLITFSDTDNTLLLTAASGVGINKVTPTVGLHIAAPVGSSQICIYSNSDLAANTGTHVQWQTQATSGDTTVGFQVWNGGGTSQNALHIQPFGGFTHFGGSYTNAPKSTVTIAGTLTLLEQAAADGDNANYGQIWVKNAAPNELWFTNDAGTDVQLGIAASLVTAHESTYNHANYNTAYSHSQLTSGNPHSVTPTELSLLIGTDTQAWDAQLDDISALAVTNGNFMVGDGSNWVAESGDTARTSLGVGTGDSPTFADLTLTSPSNIYALSHDSFADVHQDVNTDASPTFAGYIIKDVVETIVAYLDGNEFYITEYSAVTPGVGNPVGLLLVLTYAS